MFAAEARGLAWLGEARALRIPEVVAVSAPGRRAAVPGARAGGDRRAGAATSTRSSGAGWRRCTAAARAGFGLDHDNFIGWLPQANAPAATWAGVLPRRGGSSRSCGARPTTGSPRRGCGRASSGCSGGSTSCVGPAEPPARLHGDLWGGNLICDDRGAPCLIDPAVYGGHREIDLAMMRLFGGFGARRLRRLRRGLAARRRPPRARAALPALSAHGSRQPVRRRLRRVGARRPSRGCARFAAL